MVLASLLVITQIRAAGVFTAFEAEVASLTGNASFGSDSNASGAQYVQFNSQAQAGRTCPAYPAFPDANCTGVPPGTVLTIKNGNQTINTAGTVVDGWDVRGKLIINAANVTVKNSIVHGPAAGGCSNGAAIEAEGDNVTITDVEVVMDHQTACLDGVWLDGIGATVTRAHVHGGTDGFKAANNNQIIQDSYIHDMVWNANDPNQGNTETHNDGVQSYPPNRSNQTLRHNRIDMSTVKDTSGNLAANAAWQDGTLNSRLENNYLDGGGCTINIANGTSQTLTPIYINNNHFGRTRGFNGCVVLISNNSVMTEYNGNVYHDTLTAVPTWQQHN